MQHRCRATPPKNFGVAPPPPACAGRKGVALHGGVAATVAGVALHCATKLVTREPKHPSCSISTEVRHGQSLENGIGNSRGPECSGFGGLCVVLFSLGGKTNTIEDKSGHFGTIHSTQGRRNHDSHRRDRI